MLIADDEPDIRALVRHILERPDVDVVEAATASATLAAWREQRPDVIVLDQRIPPVSGLAIAEQILTEDPTQVIFLFTALVDSVIHAECERVGITLCVPKERMFDLPDLIREHLSRA